MDNPRKKDFVDDRVDQTNGEDFEDSSSVETQSAGVVEISRVGSREIGLAERLSEILVEEGDGDLLMQQSDREDRVLQWLQALDMQVLGACRVDERLKPLLKMNVSSGVAEDRLLAQLSEHFEPSEVGMLARCFCIPLVTIRVGKVNKQGTLLCPTTTRGNLNLMVLPSSALRLSFIGDDGHAERLITLNSRAECNAVVIEEISEDNSGRSFLIKIPNGSVFYFWCSEKSKLLGVELLAKMKDLLKRKPSIAELTGIRVSRLDCFATQLRAFLVGSMGSNTLGISGGLSPHSYDSSFDVSDTSQNAQSSTSKSPRCRHIGSQVSKANSIYQVSLSPRSSSFKEGQPRSLSALRSVSRDKLRRRGDYFSAGDNHSIASPVVPEGSTSTHSKNEDLPEVVKSCPFSPSFLESLGKFAVPPSLRSASQVPSTGSLFSPYYCWCPTVASTLQHSIPPPQPPASTELPLPFLPPLSSLLSATRSTSLMAPTGPLSLVDIPPMNFPAFLPEPLSRLPISMPSSHPIPTFTPLMCDPIVHIPVIDVCSSGQGYLVSAGPAISTTIPPLHPTLVYPLIPETDSVLEKGARETLRLLLSSSSQASPQLMDVLPTVLTNAEEKKPSILVTGSRGLYNGTSDIDAIAKSIAAMGLVSLSGRSIGGSDHNLSNAEAQSRESDSSDDGSDDEDSE